LNLLRRRATALPATAVLAQADFTGGECNGGVFLATDLGGLGPDSFCFSAQGGRNGLAFDGNQNLVVTDSANDRTRCSTTRSESRFRVLRNPSR
jgi:hypothetical protein